MASLLAHTKNAKMRTQAKHLSTDKGRLTKASVSRLKLYFCFKPN